MISIDVTSVLVEDQQRALAFYTDVLGFQPALDIPLGEYRWLTVVSPKDPEGVQLLLEPNVHPAAKRFQKAIHDDGIPATTFKVDDVQAEYERLSGMGVQFVREPSEQGHAITAVLEDTCGNLVSLHQIVGEA